MTQQQLAAEFGISRQTGHKWLQRYRAEGATGVLVERSRAPKRRPAEAPPEVVSACIELRERWPDWGARKLHCLLEKQRPELPLVGVSTVQRILAREGLLRKQDRHSPAIERFERAAPNELWQMDFKGPQGFRQRSGPLSVLDDHSRFLLALEHLENARTRAVQNCLRKTFDHHGLPEEMLIDHGTPWWNANSPWGWTELSVWIMRQGIRIRLSGVGHPQTQGKVERMHLSLVSAIHKRRADADQQNWLDEFREEYNHVRPHEALGMATPASRWKPSSRPFFDDAPAWEYPANRMPVRLNHAGQMRWQDRRWNVSRALHNQTVGLEVTGNRALIYFCNMPVQELDLISGATAPLPVDPFRFLHC
jgi:transposase InsO family protein